MWVTDNNTTHGLGIFIITSSISIYQSAFAAYESMVIPHIGESIMTACPRTCTLHTELGILLKNVLLYIS